MEDRDSVIQQFVASTLHQESTNNYAEPPNDDGCSGGYQFQQGTWDSACEVAGLTNYVGTAPYQAPPEVQDAVATAYAGKLYDLFGGSVAYMSNAWYAGEEAAKSHYASGTLPTTPEANGLSQAQYSQEVAARLGQSPQGINYDDVDTSLVTGDVDGLDPLMMKKLALVFSYAKEIGIEGAFVTSGASGEHAENSWHYQKEGADIAWNGLEWGSDKLKALANYARSLGFAEVIDEEHGTGPHLHLGGAHVEGNGEIAPVYSNPLVDGMARHINSFTNFMSTSPWVQQVVPTDPPVSSFWNRFSTSFMDAFTNTGTADVVQAIWGNIFHSSNHLGQKDILTDDDVKKVKNALPNDPEAQRFVLLNGRDSEEIDWLINQKLVDKKRRDDIARMTEGIEFKLTDPSSWKNFGGAELGALAGNIADPVMLVPMGEVAKLGTAYKILSRVGQSVTRLDKVAKFAEIGAKNAMMQTVDNAVRQEFGGENKTPQEYGWSAVTAFMAGAVLSGVGDAFTNMKLGRQMSKEIAYKAERAEDAAMLHAGDIRVPASVENETIGAVQKYHDASFSPTVKSASLTKLESNGRAFALSFEDAKKVVFEASGKILPDNAKAFYVPNEDYTVIIKDNIKKKDNIDKLLGHEFVTHSGLRRALGEDGYVVLMDEVKKAANKEGTTMYEARKLSHNKNDYEEVLASAIENDLLAGNVLTRVRSMMNSALKEQGYKVNFTKGQVKEIMKDELNAQREAHSGIFKNPDGSTAFAGLRFSKENLLNPDYYASLYQLEQPIKAVTQDNIGNHLKYKVFQEPMRWLTRHLDRLTPFGRMATSTSNTIRSYANALLDDARGRAKQSPMLSAETQRKNIMDQLVAPYLDYASARFNWIVNNKMKVGRKSFAEYDRAVVLAYNAEHAGNKAGYIEKLSPEIAEGVKALKNYRDTQISLGKKSGDMFGAKGSNMIEADWKGIDNELWRTTTNELRHKFIFDNFDGDPKKAAKFLEEYYRMAAKHDVIKEKIARSRAKENKRIEKDNASKEKYNKSHPDTPKELEEKLLDNPKDITAEEVEEYLKTHVPVAVEHMLHSNFDALSISNKSELGSLNFFKERVPIDTSMVVNMPNGIEFSFDNNLRDFDMDKLIQRNASRFSGEVAVKNIFGSQKAMKKKIDAAEVELRNAVENHVIDGSVAEKELANFKDSIDELRGYRPNRDTLDRTGALLRILQGLAYAKNGANMGFNQLGEVAGTIAYSGAGQIFRIVPSLGKLYEDAKFGKLTAQTIRDAESAVFGRTVDSEIWTVNYGDRVIRDALTKKSLLNDMLVFAGDKVHDLGKVTSTLNQLPRMTDSMVRGVRIQTMMDSLRWANGEKFSKLRNPFSKYKLEASGITYKVDVNEIKDNLKLFTKTDELGNVISFDWKGWRQASPKSFHQWYDLIQKQSERAIVSGTRQGNRIIAKDENAISRAIFQFKDYNLRAINAQTLRAMSSGELDDAMAAMLSMATNTAVFVARAGATYATMKAVGLDQKAEDYWKQNCSPEQLGTVALIRSTMVGSPLSPVNDVVEAATGRQTVRTTVERQTATKRSNRDASDIAGDFISQLPAFREAWRPVEAIQAFNNMSEDRVSKRDFKNLIGILPIPNLIPVSQYLNKVVEQSSYPDKRPPEKK